MIASKQNEATMRRGRGIAVEPTGTLRHHNDLALAALGIVPGIRPTANPGRVAIGFVDYGFDLLHPTLREVGTGKSAFVGLWDQNATPDARQRLIDPATIEDWSAATIDRQVSCACQQGSRRLLDELYDPHSNECGHHDTIGGAHGTLMASIAAGRPFRGFCGAAPQARLIGVQLALADHDWKEQTPAGIPTWIGVPSGELATWSGWRSYDERPQIVNAIRYLYDRAVRAGVEGLVINLSIGAWAGAHDGRSLVERGIAALVREAGDAFCEGRGPRTVVVAGAGNAGADEGHWAGEVSAGNEATFEWVMQGSDRTQNKLEIWYEPTDAVLPDVTVDLPDSRRQQLSPGPARELVCDNVRVGIADHVIDASGGKARVRLLVYPPHLAWKGRHDTARFRLTLRTKSGAPTTVHAWIERDDGPSERSWLEPSHPASSLCCLATAAGAIVVGAYDHREMDQSHSARPMPLSGRGPAPWVSSAKGGVPHFYAPGARIWGARSKSRGFAETSGTSVAVALTSGAIAQLWAQRGVSAALPAAEGAWCPGRGHGRFCTSLPVETGAVA